MPNAFLSVQQIAREALVVLRNNLVVSRNVRMTFPTLEGQAFNKGDTVQVRKRPTFAAAEFTSTTSAQDITETNVLVSVNHHADVSMEITSRELSLSVDDFNETVVIPAMQAIAQKVDADVMGEVLNIPYYAGTAGTTPSTIAPILAARKKLNDNKVPLAGRIGIIDTAAEASLLAIDTFAEADKRGDSQTLREASLGRVYGVDWYTSQNVRNVTNGTSSGGTATGTAGATTITIASGGNAGTFKAGQLITIAGDTTQYVVTADATLNGSGAGTVSLYPALASSPSGANITYVAAHAANIIYHPDAFGLVMVPLALPMGGAESYVTSFEGLTIRVSMGYNMVSKKNMLSFDCLYGTKTLQPELAVRLLG